MGLLDRVKSDMAARKAAGLSPLPPPPATPPPSPANAAIAFKVLGEHAAEVEGLEFEAARDRVTVLVDACITESGLTFTELERDRIIKTVLDEALGLGPIQHMVDDPDYSEIFVNHPNQVYAQFHGEYTLTDATFQSPEQLIKVMERVLAAAGIDIDETGPITELRLADGTRVTAILPPVAQRGPCLVIRKFSRTMFSPEDLSNRFHSLSPGMMTFLRACVKSGFSIAVTGPRGAGKTTLLGALASLIPDPMRIITCERVSELLLKHDDIVNLESGELPELIPAAQTLRADWILVGECTGGEVVDLLHSVGSLMTTVRAYSVADGLEQLARLAKRAAPGIENHDLHMRLSAMIQVLVHVSRLSGGVRRITSISEVVGTDADGVRCQEIFKFVQTGIDDFGAKAVGYHTATGVRSSLLGRLQAEGEEIDQSIFKPTPQPAADKQY